MSFVYERVCLLIKCFFTNGFIINRQFILINNTRRNLNSNNYRLNYSFQMRGFLNCFIVDPTCTIFIIHCEQNWMVVSHYCLSDFKRWASLFVMFVWLETPRENKTSQLGLWHTYMIRSSSLTTQPIILSKLHVAINSVISTLPTLYVVVLAQNLH